MTFVRAALHVHSDWSYDGKWPLEQIASVFCRRGYRIVMLTEHDRGFDEGRRQQHREACYRASTPAISLLPGIEYSDGLNCVHILTWGDVPFVGVNAETEDVLSAVAASGGAAVFAHPSRKDAWKSFKPEWKSKLAGIEWWNRKTDGWAPSTAAWRLLQMTNAVPFAGMDFHDSRQFFPLSTVIQVEGPISETSVIAALKGRRCQSTAFGLPVESFAKGLRAETLRCAEFSRRRAALVYRRFANRPPARSSSRAI